MLGYPIDGFFGFSRQIGLGIAAMTRQDIAPSERLFLDDVPFMDVRAPVEFAKGSFPGAVNVPILDDTQREKIGTAYKQRGKEAAIALGHQLATPKVQAERIAAWRNFVGEHPEGYLFCLRGGMRSKITASWLSDAGMPYPRIVGGYKEMRACLMNGLDGWCELLRWWVVSGRTGTGKTHLLPRLPDTLDLEGMACHRGSSFGKRVQAQPPQAGFEHVLAIALLRAAHCGSGVVAVEDESKLIGRRALPEPVITRMRAAPLVVVEVPLADRVSRIVADYVQVSANDHLQAYGEEEGHVRFAESLVNGLNGIRKRLGDPRHQEIMGVLDDALNGFQQRADLEGFRGVIESLLVHYYDPMYDYQLERKSDRVRFRGAPDAIADWVGDSWDSAVARSET